jgi:hypothetical protein
MSISEVGANIVFALFSGIAVIGAVLFFLAIASGRTDNPHK